MSTFTDSLLFWFAKAILPFLILAALVAAVVLRVLLRNALRALRRWWTRSP